MDFTEIIKIACIKRKISLTELAERTKQSQQNLTNKLRRNDFKTSELERIAAALDAELDIRFVDRQSGRPII